MASLLASRPRGDRSFERLYRRHVTGVYHYALALVGDADDAVDVTRATFRNAHAAVSRGERPLTGRGALIDIAHDVCRRRVLAAAKEGVREPSGERPPADIPRDDDVRRALGRLALDERAALVMRELEGRSYAEIADFLGLSVEELEPVVFRARQSLREQLEDSLTCLDAQFAVSRRLDGMLPRSKAARLVAHLRECDACALFDRRQRTHIAAITSIADVPLPASLAPRGERPSRVRAVPRLVGIVAISAIVGGLAQAGVGRLPAGARPAPEAPARPAAVAKTAVSPQPSALDSGIARSGAAESPRRSGAEDAKPARDTSVVFVRARPQAPSAATAQATAASSGTTLGRSNAPARKRYEKASRSAAPTESPAEQPAAESEPVLPAVPAAQPVAIPAVPSPPTLPLPGLPAPPKVGE